MKIKFKKITAILSSAVMLFTSAAISPDGMAVDFSTTITATAQEDISTAVAQVETDGATAYYDTIKEAWAAADGKTATVTLLSDVAVSDILTASKGSVITLDCGGHTITGSGQNTLKVSAEGSLTVKNGTVVNTKGNGTTMFVGGSWYNTTLTVMADVTIIAPASGKGIYSYSTVNVYGKVIGEYCGVWSDSGTLNVYPGAVISGEYGIYASTSPKVYLFGGSITGTNQAIGKSGGTITVAEGLGAYLDGTALTLPITSSTAAGTIIVGGCTDGHTFDDAGLCSGCNLQAAAKAEKEGADAIYVTSLASAFTQDNSGAAVTLLCNVTTTETIYIDGSAFTLNLNNKKITQTKNLSVFYIHGGGSLTVEGDGSIISEKYHGIWVQNDSTLTVNGGTIQTKGSHYHGIYVDGGTVTVNSGAHIISPNNADYYAALNVCMGTANIYGGTFTGGVSRTSTGVLNLYGGTFSGVDGDGVSVGTYGRGAICDLLAENHAYFRDNVPVTSGLNENELTGTVTVKECTHTGDSIWGYAQLGENQHQSACLACGYTSGDPEDCTPDDKYGCDNTNHWNECTVCKRKCNEIKHSFDEWAADNTRVCTDCGYKQTAVAKVEIDGDIACYGDILEAWKAADGETATVTLLSDVTTSVSLWVTDDNITFDGGSYTLMSTGKYGAFCVYGGSLTISGGTIKVTADMAFGVYVYGGTVSISGGNIQATGDDVGCGVFVEGGTVSITGGNIQGTGDGMGLGVFVGGGTVSISGGTFTGSDHAIYYPDGLVADLLLNHGTDNTPHYAYFDDYFGTNTPYTPEQDESLPSGTFTVKECGHSAADVTDNNDGTHSINSCPACGFTGTEACTYGEEYQHDKTNHWLTCTLCGGKKTEAHSFTKYVSNNDATCIKDGTKTATCDKCDETNTITDEKSATGHSFTKYVSDKNATCTQDGTKTAKCDNCAATDTITDKGTAKGHSFTKYVSDGNATCTKDGTKTAKCDNCAATDTITDKGTAKGHSFTKYVSNGDATYTKDGTKTAKCDNCAETDTITDENSKLTTTATTTITTTKTTTTTTTTKATTTTAKTTTTSKVTTVTTTTPASKLLGDVNGDNEISVADVVLLQSYLVKNVPFTEAQRKLADMNSDGKVNVFDYIILKRKILK